ncbi:hypothetical protein ACFO5K_10520 [Nocardia halotolerans]|uniref:Uncharacterized protein n=1 Tax=Nocardia halotolerans TaxID=1755878 RepID=A0ABV8VFL3_9NOCA
MVHPGNMTPAYGCGCDESEGIAWTRVLMIAPPTVFPQILAAPVQPGPQVQLAATTELGVDRCYYSTEDNSMPEPDILDSPARDALDDAAAMHRAVMCAGLGAVVVGSWQPRGRPAESTAAPRRSPCSSTPARAGRRCHHWTRWCRCSPTTLVPSIFGC